MTRTILNGDADVTGDTPPPPAELRSITGNPSTKDQLTFTPQSVRYVSLNTARPPFDNKFVRMAVAYALDRNAMRLTRGGPVDGRIATHFIDPSFGDKGFTQAGGFEFNPFPTSEPGASDLDKARQMLKKAGFANGRFSGPALTQVADNTPPGSDTAKVVANSLAKIGMKVRTISVTHSTMFTRFCNVPNQEPNICPNVGWIEDFHEPQAMLDATFNGENIVPVNISNWPQLNDPRINALMAKAETILDPQQRYAAWGKIDQLVSETAAAIPWLWESFPTLFSDQVTKAPELWNLGSPDVTFMQVVQ
jgi:peptide/nickel transport system substrate-binding protein